jgi:signal transduction histidine kinase
MNILSNAFQSIQDRGKVYISTYFDKMGLSISIRDTGSGIDEKHIDKIFDPFFTTKEQGKGTGLGLSISYSIIQKHNGDIIVKSKKGEGTEFIILLPINNDELKNV